jgi:hypothetical protein
MVLRVVFRLETREVSLKIGNEIRMLKTPSPDNKIFFNVLRKVGMYCVR